MTHPTTGETLNLEQSSPVVQKLVWLSSQLTSCCSKNVWWCWGVTDFSSWDHIKLQVSVLNINRTAHLQKQWHAQRNMLFQL